MHQMIMNRQRLLAEVLEGELCYVQTASIYHGLTDNHNGINIKREIASAFKLILTVTTLMWRKLTLALITCLIIGIVCSYVVTC